MAQMVGVAHHGGQHHVDRTGLDDLLQGCRAGVDLDVGLVGEQFLQPPVMRFVGYHHGGGLELTGLRGELLHPIVGREAIYLVQVAVLSDDIECLRANASGGTENANLLFHTSIKQCINHWFQSSRMPSGTRT